MKKQQQIYSPARNPSPDDLQSLRWLGWLACCVTAAVVLGAILLVAKAVL